jgi:hypothetical protein
MFWRRGNLKWAGDSSLAIMCPAGGTETRYDTPTADFVALQLE